MEDRHAAYRALIRERLDAAFVEALRVGTNGSWALGGERFRKEIEAAAERRAAPPPLGLRPKPAKKRETDETPVTGVPILTPISLNVLRKANTQAPNIVVHLGDSTASAEDIVQVLQENPGSNLNSVYFIDNSRVLLYRHR